MGVLQMRAFLAFLLCIKVTAETTLTVFNNCNKQVWPVVQSSPGKPTVARGGFKLEAGEARTMQLPSGWSGRVSVRQDCTFNNLGQGRCATGDCGAGLYCNGLGGAPPATVVELTLGAETDSYSVSLVGGYSIAMSITPFKGTGGNCAPAGCIIDLNRMCPAGLQVKARDNKVVACRSESRTLKVACPQAYSYEYSVSTCTDASYVIELCPEGER